MKKFLRRLKPKWFIRWQKRLDEGMRQRKLIKARKLIWEASHPQTPGTAIIFPDGRKMMVENVTLDLRKNLLHHKYTKLKGNGPNRKQRSAMRLKKERESK